MAAAATTPTRQLVDHYLPTNPVPFAIALTVLAIAMLAFPKSAVWLGIVVTLGALLTEQSATSKAHLSASSVLSSLAGSQSSEELFS